MCLTSSNVHWEEQPFLSFNTIFLFFLLLLYRTDFCNTIENIRVYLDTQVQGSIFIVSQADLDEDILEGNREFLCFSMVWKCALENWQNKNTWERISEMLPSRLFVWWCFLLHQSFALCVCKRAPIYLKKKWSSLTHHHHMFPFSLANDTHALGSVPFVSWTYLAKSFSPYTPIVYIYQHRWGILWDVCMCVHAWCVHEIVLWKQFSSMLE